MKSSQFMDKQIMDLSSSSSPPPSTDFIDLINNKITNNNSLDDDDHQKQQHQHRIGDNNELESKKEVPIVPSYDFQPIRPYTAGGLSHSALDLAGSTTATRAWSMNDTKPNSNSSNRGFESLNSLEPAKLVPEKALDMSIMMSEIDKTMKKHTDTLLHVMEGVSARLTQLEGRTHDLENLVDDLKVSVESNHGSTDGKMRKLENILLEVRSGVQNLKDKQEIIEAQLQLSKLKVDQHPETNSLHLDPTTQTPAPVPNPPMQQMPQFPVTSFPQPPSSSSPAAAPHPSQQILQPPSLQLLAHLPSQFSPQQEPYSHSQPPPPNQRPYQAPPQTQTLPPPHQPPYQPPPQQPQYPQQPPPQSLGYNNPEEQLPYPKQSYTPNPAGSVPSQQFYNAPQLQQPSMYDGGAGGRSNPGYLSEPYSYSGSPKPPQSGTGGYPQLSNSRPLPHALPMASAVNSSGSSSPRSEGRVPLEDVIDRVTTMGFPRNQVRETVRKLTDNGQAVDLNVVLDKLMNPGGGGGGAPPEGWFGGQPF